MTQQSDAPSPGATTGPVRGTGQAGSKVDGGDINPGQAWSALFSEGGRPGAFVFRADFGQAATGNDHVVTTGDQGDPFADPFQFLVANPDDQIVNDQAGQSILLDAALVSLSQDDFRFG